MAWISVHQSIVGSKLRKFRSLLDCSQWEAEGILVSLWLWGLDNADKFGLIPYADRSDIEIALSGSSKGSNTAIPAIVDGLIESGWIDEVEDGIYIHDWEVWQEQWYKAKENREKDAERKRVSRSKKKEELLPEPIDEQSEEIPVDSPADIPQKPASKPSGALPNAAPAPKDPPKYGPEFEEFWKVYPRHVEKANAHEKYNARRKEGWSAEEILEAAKVYAAQCKRLRTANEYIKHPKTFLGANTPFVDFIPKKDQNKEAAPNGNPWAEYGKEE